MLIKSMNLANIRLMDYFQVMTLINGYLAKEPQLLLKLKPQSDAFSTALSALELSFHQAQKSGYTDKIAAADDNRDNIFIGLNGMVQSMTRFPDKAIADAATAILLLIQKHGEGIIRLPQREETAVIASILSELKSAEMAPAVQLIGLTPWVDKLYDANTDFSNLYSNRTEKEAEFINGLTRAERQATQLAFEQLVRAIEAYAFIDGEAAYKSLADKINTEIGKAQQAGKSRSTLNQNSENTKNTGLK